MQQGHGFEGVFWGGHGMFFPCSFALDWLNINIY